MGIDEPASRRPSPVECGKIMAVQTVQDRISRRSFLASAGSAVAGLSCASQTDSALPLPNIVICMGDDHGWHETGYNGHPIVKTPVLDEMAAAGLRLDRFFAAAPVCSPTRGSVMTGRHPNRYGTFSANWSIRPEEITIAQILRDVGYACGHFGKWHLGPVKEGSPTNPGAMGFEEWLSHDNFFEMDPCLSRNGGPPEEHKGESSEIIVEAANRFISKAKSEGRPFFAVIWFGSPHEPYSGQDEDLEAYSDLPAHLAEQTARITSMETGRPGEFPLNEVLQARFAEITAMDRSMGILREHLTAEGVREDTLLWYCSDNGAPAQSRFESPMRADKGQVYEGGVRVPGLIEWPSRVAEPRSSAVHGVTSDILPTLCELTGQALPERPLDGVSLVPVIDGTSQARSEPICFWRYAGDVPEDADPYIDPELQKGTTQLVKMMDGRFTRNFRNFHHPEILEADREGPRAILDSQYKLVVDGAGQGASGDAGSPTKELFDIRRDPAESNDLASANPEIVERLEGKLSKWQESVLNSLTGADYT